MVILITIIISTAKRRMDPNISTCRNGRIADFGRNNLQKNGNWSGKKPINDYVIHKALMMEPACWKSLVRGAISLRSLFPGKRLFMSKTDMMRCFLLYLLFCVPSYTAVADTIHLKNGKSLDGIIIRETEDEAVLETGHGTMTISKSRIATIDKSSSEDQSRIVDTWTRNHDPVQNDIRANLSNLTSAVDQLRMKRQSAIEASADLAQTRTREEALRKECTALMDELTKLGEKLKAPNSRNDITAYNNLVFQNNALRAEIVEKQKDINGIRDIQERLSKEMADYSASVSEASSQFGKQFQEYRASDKTDAQKDRYFKNIQSDLKQFEDDIVHYRISTTTLNGNKIIYATLNGTTSGRFVVDTGASVVSISRSLADRIGLSTDSGDTSQVTLADGRKVTALNTIFESIQVGNARVEQVRGLILDESPAPGVDGLLGMTFLSQFVVRLDGRTGELVLEHIKP
jgi:clan AA aspartic protease (TIGR02281 family)